MCLDICEKVGGSSRRRLNSVGGRGQIHVAFSGVWKGTRFRVISTLRREGMGIQSLDFSSIWTIRVGAMPTLLRPAGPQFPFYNTHTNSFSSARLQFLSYHNRTVIWAPLPGASEPSRQNFSHH